jgi:tRNA(Ile)-lysidine synthase
MFRWLTWIASIGLHYVSVDPMSMDCLPIVESCLAEAWPTSSWRDVHVVAAVSGGPDSVAMLRALWALKRRAGGQGTLYVAHLNHLSRGEASDADQAWLEQLCHTLGIPLEVDRADVAALAAKQGDGWESAARLARYDFLRHTAQRLGARWVAVAHTADDQVETVLHRLVRGTGLAGLAGMHRVRSLSPTVTLVRPLLGLGREELRAYLADIGQGFCHDSTNADVRYTRNRLRHELLPALRADYNTKVDEALTRLAQRADEAQQIISRLVDGLVEQSVRIQPGRVEPAEGGDCADSPPAVEVRIDCGPLESEPMMLVREVCRVAWSAANWPLQSMGYVEWQQLADQVRHAAARPLSLPGGMRARRHDGVVEICNPAAAEVRP